MIVRNRTLALLGSGFSWRRIAIVKDRYDRMFLAAQFHKRKAELTGGGC